jgi:hypothetical protein
MCVSLAIAMQTPCFVYTVIIHVAVWLQVRFHYYAMKVTQWKSYEMFEPWKWSFSSIFIVEGCHEIAIKGYVWQFAHSRAFPIVSNGAYQDKPQT